MIYSTVLLESLAKLPRSAWQGIVYRHMFGLNSPKRENRLGARWNPPDVPAIYCCLEQETAVSEGDFQISTQPFRPIAERRIHRVEVSLNGVVQLTDWQLLESLGIDRASYADIEPPRCKEIGGALQYLGHDGILVPSARHKGLNLVIYPTEAVVFEEIDFSVVA